jgi:hypothetical protein
MCFGLKNISAQTVAGDPDKIMIISLPDRITCVCVCVRACVRACVRVSWPLSEYLPVKGVT